MSNNDWRRKSRVRAFTTVLDAEGRECTKCGKYKLWSEFSLDRATRSGHNSRCSQCMKGVIAAWRLKSDYYNQNQTRLLAEKKQSYDPVAKKDYDLRSKYGITLKQLREMLRHQGHACKICLTRLYAFSKGRRNNRVAVVDHCHKTGKTRGLLCHNCNRAIGLAGDNATTLSRATKYVRSCGRH